MGGEAAFPLSSSSEYCSLGSCIKHCSLVTNLFVCFFLGCRFYALDLRRNRCMYQSFFPISSLNNPVDHQVCNSSLPHMYFMSSYSITVCASIHPPSPCFPIIKKDEIWLDALFNYSTIESSREESQWCWVDARGCMRHETAGLSSFGVRNVSL